MLTVEFDKGVDAQSLLRFLEKRFKCKINSGRRITVEVEVDARPRTVKESLKKFLHRSGYRDYRILIEGDALKIKRTKEKSDEKRRRGRKETYAPPPRSSLPYFFPG